MNYYQMDLDEIDMAMTDKISMDMEDIMEWGMFAVDFKGRAKRYEQLVNEYGYS